MMQSADGDFRYLKEVEGRPVKFAAFPNHKFILHRYNEEWRVSEETTGLYFVAEPTPNEALHKAKAILLKQGENGIAKAMDKAKQIFAAIPLKDYDAKT